MKKLLNRTSILLICVWLLSVSVSAVKMLIPVGQVVGLELCDNTVTVSSFDDKLGAAAKQAGLQVGDRITEVNGHAIHTAEDIRYALNRSDGGSQPERGYPSLCPQYYQGRAEIGYLFETGCDRGGNGYLV